MTDTHNPAGYDEAELAYLNSRGEVPLPPGEDEGAQPEPEQDAASASEPAPEDTDPEIIEPGADEDRHKGRKVGYSAYLRQKGEADAARKEREEYRAKLEAREREFAAQQARIDERFKLWQASQAQAAQQQAPQEAPKPPPNPDDDPLAYIRYQDQKRQELEQQLQGIVQTQQQRDAQTRQVQQIQQLDSAYRADNQQAAREMPEYPAAYNFLLSMAERDVQIQNGGRLTPAQVKQHVEHQERQLAAAAFQQGMRPAAMILQMAQARGYQPQASQQQATQPDPASEQARIDAAARGQQQNRSLSGTGRSAAAASTAGAMTLEKFINLSDDEARVWAEKNPADYMRIGGGR